METAAIQAHVPSDVLFDFFDQRERPNVLPYRAAVVSPTPRNKTPDKPTMQSSLVMKPPSTRIKAKVGAKAHPISRYICVTISFPWPSLPSQND